MWLVCFWFCKNRKEMANCWTVRRNYFKAFTCTECNFCLFAECWDHISPLKEVSGFWLNLVGGESALSCQANLFWTVHHNVSTTLPLQMERFWLLAILTEAFCFFLSHPAGAVPKASIIQLLWFQLLVYQSLFSRYVTEFAAISDFHTVWSLWPHCIKSFICLINALWWCKHDGSLCKSPRGGYKNFLPYSTIILLLIAV